MELMPCLYTCVPMSRPRRSVVRLELQPKLNMADTEAAKPQCEPSTGLALEDRPAGWHLAGIQGDHAVLVHRLPSNVPATFGACRWPVYELVPAEKPAKFPG